ncbi:MULTISPECIES: NUDIX domain-containing protein [Colwellia]|uniref:DNA mismatch repair protein MutT n=1 Tax=Colwellia marinimaniae TaxID=1513592 RepID=A0ABQ0MR42_9GAMM|nr:MULTISPECIES: NUDIX hydrolase [Colwellia]GAW94825.1 DNA mismatch repair protein MutT [Colwellia marinimaniae]
MRLLKSTIHPNINPLTVNSPDKKRFIRKATRAIVLNGESILLLYTKRYHDYSLPGGGIDAGESHIDGLVRELKEETGAHNVRNIVEFGLYEEFRPWHKAGFDFVHMQSYCYTCTIDEELLEPEFETHELNNGMQPVWMNIHQAIAHNEATMATSKKKGLSIERETFLLKLIVSELVNESVPA